MDLRKLKVSYVTVIVCALAAVMWTEFFLTQNNVLMNKTEWRHALEGSINPGVNFLPSVAYRRPLLGFRLRSDEIHGVHRLFSRKSVTPEKAKVWFKIGDDAYLDLIFGANEKEFTALRLSSSTVFPSGIYHSLHSGKFLSFTKIPLLLERGNYSAEVKGNQLSIDGKTMTLPESILVPGEAGVQISFRDIELFAFEVKGAQDQFFLHFLPTGDRVTLYLRHFSLIMILVVAFGYFQWFEQRQTALILLGLGTIGFVAGFTGIAEDEDLAKALNRIDYLDSWWRPEGMKRHAFRMDEIHKDKYLPHPFVCREDGCSQVLNIDDLKQLRTGPRIVLFTGSACKPSLVPKLEDSFYVRFDHLLRKSRPGIETVLLDSEGDFRTRLKQNEEKLVEIGPDEIIIEVLAFDNEVEVIKDFIQRWKNKGVRIVLLRRAQNIERFSETEAPIAVTEILKGPSTTHSGEKDFKWPEIVRTVGNLHKASQEIGFEFYDPNEVLLKEDVLKSGQIFWDGYHFTAWGQELFAEWLASKVAHAPKD